MRIFYMNKIISFFIVLTAFSSVAKASEIDPSRITSYACRGSEPFWLLDIAPSSISYESPEGKMAFTPVKPAEGAGLKPGLLRVYKTAFKADPVNITIKYTGKCSDGMSEKSYPFESVVTLKSGVLSGCCDGK